MKMQDLIEGDLRVGPFRPGDAPAFAQAARESAGSLGPWMPWCHAAYSEAEAAEWIALCAANVENDNSFDLGIYSADRALLLGGMAINQISRFNLLGNIGYWVRGSHQRRGIATRAARLIARFGFGTLGLIRLEIRAAVDNQASCAVARKLGAKFEGIARKRLLLHGVAHDAANFGLLPEDLDGPVG